MTRAGGRSARRPPAHPRAPAPRRGRASAARCATSRSPTSTSTSSNVESRSLHVHLPRLLAAVHLRRRRRRALPGRARPLRRRRRTSRCRRATWDAFQIPVERGLLLPQLVARTGSRPSTRARPAPPSRCSPLDAWDDLVAANPILGDAGRPTSRRCSSGSATTGTTAFLVPIDACYELVGQMRRLWRGFDGGREAQRRPRPVLRRSCRARADERRMSDLAIEVARRRAPSRYAAVPDAAVPPRPSPSRAATRSTPSPCGPRSRSSRSAGATRRTRRRGCSSCSASTPQWGESLRPFLWTHATTMLTGFTGRTEVDLPVAVHLRLRGGGGQVPARARRRRDPAGAAVQRHGLRPPRRRRVGAAGAVARRGRLPPAGRGLARADGPVLPRTAAGSGSAARPSTRSPATRPSGPSRRGSDAFELLLKEAGGVSRAARGRRRGVRAGRRGWPTPCSTRATSSTRTGRRRPRTRCAGSSACSPPGPSPRPTAPSSGRSRPR